MGVVSANPRKLLFRPYRGQLSCHLFTMPPSHVVTEAGFVTPEMPWVPLTESPRYPKVHASFMHMFSPASPMKPSATAALFSAPLAVSGGPVLEPPVNLFLGPVSCFLGPPVSQFGGTLAKLFG